MLSQDCTASAPASLWPFGYGYCCCGCGSPTKLALRNERRLDVLKGQPFRFLHGHNRFTDLTGRTFGRLTVLYRAARSANKHTKWMCRCSCPDGTLKAIRADALLDEMTHSCGCLDREVKQLVTHGASRRGAVSPTYRSWSAMLDRCSNAKNPKYRIYGGRGITVCERWHTFIHFLADMGERPPGCSIDRFPNPNGHYEPGNCRWATSKEQARNTSRNVYVTWHNETHCLTEWAELLGIRVTTLVGRYKKHLPMDALFAPTKHILRGTERPGVKLTEADIHAIRAARGRVYPSLLAKEYGVSEGCISSIWTRRNWAWLD